MTLRGQMTFMGKIPWLAAGIRGGEHRSQIDHLNVRPLGKPRHELFAQKPLVAGGEAARLIDERRAGEQGNHQVRTQFPAAVLKGVGQGEE